MKVVKELLKPYFIILSVLFGLYETILVIIFQIINGRLYEAQKIHSKQRNVQSAHKDECVKIGRSR